MLPMDHTYLDPRPDGGSALINLAQSHIGNGCETRGQPNVDRNLKILAHSRRHFGVVLIQGKVFAFTREKDEADKTKI